MVNNLTMPLVLGVTVEWVAVHVLQRWAYAARMPRVPWLDVGLIPVAQMLVLPPLIFRLVAGWYRRIAGLTCGWVVESDGTRNQWRS